MTEHVDDMWDAAADVPAETSERTVTLTFRVRGPLNRHLPDQAELVSAMLDGLPSAWFDPDDGDNWWIYTIEGS